MGGAILAHLSGPQIVEGGLGDGDLPCQHHE